MSFKISSLNITKTLTGNPFVDHPQLNEIWADPYRSIAIEAITEDLASAEEVDIGSIFLIKSDDKVIGITGYYIYDYEPNELSPKVSATKCILGLRWHGLVPDQRGSGFSKEVIKMVLAEARSKHPEASTMIELIPVNPYGETLKGHFNRLGFKSVGAIEKYEWADNFWQPFHLDIDRFLKNEVSKSKMHITI